MGLTQDLRQSIHQLYKFPAFTTAAVIILAIGIGANTAIFGAIHSILLNPFDFPHSSRIVLVDACHVSGKNSGTGVHDFLDWREQNSVFDDMAIVPWTGKYTLTGQWEPESVTGGRTTPGLLRVLAVQPILGRFFTTDEDRAGSPDVAVLNYATWQRRFGADKAVLGRTIFWTVGHSRSSVYSLSTSLFQAPRLANS